MIRLSASSIKDLNSDGCGVKTHLKYIQKLPEQRLQNPWSVYGSFGSTLHETIAHVIEFGQVHNESFILEKWNKDYQNIFLSDTEHLKKKVDFYKMGSELLDDWKNDYIFRGWDLSQPIMVEKYCRFPLVDHIWLSGYIDCVFEKNDSIYLIDWKSQKTPPSQEEVDNSIQLTAYYWFLKQLGYTPDYMGLYLIRHGTFMQTQRNSRHVDTLIDSARKSADKLDRTHLLAEPTEKRCMWCGYFEKCEAYKENIPMVYDVENDKFSKLEN